MESAGEVLWLLPRCIDFWISVWSARNAGKQNKKHKHEEYYWDLKSSRMGIEQKYKPQARADCPMCVSIHLWPKSTATTRGPHTNDSHASPYHTISSNSKQSSTQTELNKTSICARYPTTTSTRQKIECRIKQYSSVPWPSDRADLAGCDSQ